MEFIFQFIFDLVFEGSKETAKNKNINPWIRIPCLILLFVVSITLFGGLAFFGIYMIINSTDNTSYLTGIVFLILDLN